MKVQINLFVSLLLPKDDVEVFLNNGFSEMNKTIVHGIGTTKKPYVISKHLIKTIDVENNNIFSTMNEGDELILAKINDIPIKFTIENITKDDDQIIISCS